MSCARPPHDGQSRVIPHPALGTLTGREMLFFTPFHNRHHLALVRGKLAAYERVGDQSDA